MHGINGFRYGSRWLADDPLPSCADNWFSPRLLWQSLLRALDISRGSLMESGLLQIPCLMLTFQLGMRGKRCSSVSGTPKPLTFVFADYSPSRIPYPLCPSCLVSNMNAHVLGSVMTQYLLPLKPKPFSLLLFPAQGLLRIVEFVYNHFSAPLSLGLCLSLLGKGESSRSQGSFLN